MDSFLPRNTVLGKLTMLDVYSFYDQPCLFSCRNEKGKIYLAMLFDQTDKADVFLYVELSGSRFQELLQNKLALRTAFAESESGTVLKVLLPFYDEIEVSEINSCDMPNDSLPNEGEYLSLVKVF